MLHFFTQLLRYLKELELLYLHLYLLKYWRKVSHGEAPGLDYPFLLLLLYTR
jgi:hypothetical protein